MGTCNDHHINIHNEELEVFLKPGLNLEDIQNLSKAFNQLDSRHNGAIIYDVNKIADIGKIKEYAIEDGKIRLNYHQFMEVMGNNILNNRRKYGREKIKFESDTSTAMCFICPFETK